MDAAVILYGPPASGKDTITDAMIAANPAFQLFRRLKVGTGRTATYRMTTFDHVAALENSGDVIWSNSRYDATYAVDRPELNRMVNADQIPVLHLGQVEAIEAVLAAMPHLRWTTVELWCPRDIAEQRIRARTTGDTDARLAAWDATVAIPQGMADLRIDTSAHSPAESAQQILHVVESSCHST
ncbi:phosphotransferase-like protein [Nocardia terpenica]|uniref:Guanylate kinase n=1 Tax=Nocardia terpenica TaxID=455432 RepID=A0A164MEF8_9NOCA|nr:hypothetical protein [Nocardia terpenica]KZM73286.1 hypothetical protein AWN90_31990 [Nocardia terpenica]NQE87567.1 kinase [Nocardia terpenica]